VSCIIWFLFLHSLVLELLSGGHNPSYMYRLIADYYSADDLVVKQRATTGSWVQLPQFFSYNCKQPFKFLYSCILSCILLCFFLSVEIEHSIKGFKTLAHPAQPIELDPLGLYSIGWEDWWSSCINFETDLCRSWCLCIVNGTRAHNPPTSDLSFFQ